MPAQKTRTLSNKEIIGQCEDDLTESAMKALSESAEPLEAVALLKKNSSEVADDLYSALRILALSMPQEAAVYWSWCCLSHYQKGETASTAKSCMKAAENWLSGSFSQQLADQAWRVSETVPKLTPAGWLCKSIYWCGDNVVPPDIKVEQRIKPQPGISNKTSALAIQICAIMCNPAKPQEICMQCLDLGLKIATEGIPES